LIFTCKGNEEPI
jgi:hypothetical protein